MITQPELLTLWKRLAETAGGEWSDDGFGFFQTLSNRKDLIAAALAQVQRGSEVTARVMELLASADADHSAYFLVRHPRPLQNSDALQLVEAHRDALAVLATHSGDDELLVSLEAAHISLAPSHGHEIDEITAQSIETITDYLAAVRPEPTVAAELREAFYSTACDYMLTWYLMWPWYRERVQVGDPFLPYFTLWRHGMSPCFSA